MADENLVPQFVILACSQGTTPSDLESFSNVQTTICGENVCTEVDMVVGVNFKPFGNCAAKSGNPCVPAVTAWKNLSDFMTLGPNAPLQENSVLPCSTGGEIAIFFSMESASTFMPEEEDDGGGWSFGGIAKGIGNFGVGLVKGLYTGAKGLLFAAKDLAVWSAKHSVAYALINPEGFAQQLRDDVGTIKSIGNGLASVGTWAYRSSAINYVLNPDDWKEQQRANAAAVDSLIEYASNMDAEDWGNFTGQVLFEVILEVGTGGGYAAVTGARLANRAGDAAQILNHLDNATDALRVIETGDDIGDVARYGDGLIGPPVPEQLGPVYLGGDPPGTFRDANGKLRNSDGTFASDPNTPSPVDGSIPYANHRPSYRAGQVDEVWENAKSPDGNVYDPNTGELIEWDPSRPRNGQWDMGHIQGQKYEHVHRQYMDGDITRQEFLDWYQNPNNYIPELPKNNRSNRFS